MSLSPALEAQQGTVDREGLLGRIMWYSVPTSTCLDPKVVTKELTDLGFSRKIPHLPSDTDVFRRASVQAKMERVPVDGSDDRFENWLIRSVDSAKDDAITRRIVVETVDPSGKRLQYEQIVDVEFTIDKTVDPHVSRIVVKWINGFNPTTHPRAKEVVDSIRTYFHCFQGNFHDAIMRNWIKQTIIGFGATPMSGTTRALYFLPEKHADQVEKLEGFVKKQFPPGGVCHSVEIPDTSKQREMVQQAIEEETTGAVESLLAEIDEIKKSGKLTEKKQADIQKRVRAMEGKMASYTKLLSADMRAVEARVEILAGVAKGLKPTKGTARTIDEIVQGV